MALIHKQKNIYFPVNINTNEKWLVIHYWSLAIICSPALWWIKTSFPQWFEFFKNQNPLPQSLRKEREHKARYEHLTFKFSKLREFKGCVHHLNRCTTSPMYILYQLNEKMSLQSLTISFNLSSVIF